MHIQVLGVANSLLIGHQLMNAVTFHTVKQQLLKMILHIRGCSDAMVTARRLNYTCVPRVFKFSVLADGGWFVVPSRAAMRSES